MRCRKEVFYVENHVRRAFPSTDVFVSHGFEFGNVVVVPCGFLDSILMGQPMELKSSQ